MELARRLAGFFAIATQDERLCTSHICFYLALCTLHAVSGLDNPFYITRRQVMTGCKILGNATYHKCMKDLHQYVTSLTSLLIILYWAAWSP